MTKIDESINALRMLSMDTISHANSGHPGLPLGAAPMAYTLWHDFIKSNPDNPTWFNRDRFVLSAGHGSAMLYSLLHLTGYDVSINDLKEFRKIGSKTPGHPEYKITPGVDAGTGPLGQGMAMAVGMAMAEKHLSGIYNIPDNKIIDHYTYSLVSDGDLMEGISHEAGSLAGHLNLNKLVVLYDSNDITLDDKSDKSVSDNVEYRFKGYGWNYIRVDDGNNYNDIYDAISAAKDNENGPTIIEVKTVLGFGSPLANNHLIHGNPLNFEDLEITKNNLNWKYSSFEIPFEIYNDYSELKSRGTNENQLWNEQLFNYKNNHPKLYKELMYGINDTFTEIEFSDFEFKNNHAEATRKTMHNILQIASNDNNNLWGGSADLFSSNKTNIENDSGFEYENPKNKNIYYGIREFISGSAANGITLHGGSRTYTSTFFVFSDYMKNAMRMAALQEIPTTFIFSHDSIALGPDGPTHQPVEQLASLRSMPNMVVIRPADAYETIVSWNIAMSRKLGPTTIVLSRQDLPILDNSNLLAKEGVTKGGYIISKSPENEKTDGLIIATGSEVSLAINAQNELNKSGKYVDVVSMPSQELFNNQSKIYRDSVLPPLLTKRVSIEMESTFGWGKYVGLDGVSIGVDKFGMSGSADELISNYGFTVQKVVDTYNSL